VAQNCKGATAYVMVSAVLK